jgi:hypothetical protein
MDLMAKALQTSPTSASKTWKISSESDDIWKSKARVIHRMDTVNPGHPLDRGRRTCDSKVDLEGRFGSLVLIFRRTVAQRIQYARKQPDIR